MSFTRFGEQGKVTRANSIAELEKKGKTMEDLRGRVVLITGQRAGWASCRAPKLTDALFHLLRVGKSMSSWVKDPQRPF